MRILRRITQLVFLLFFLYLFIQAAYPLESIIPPDLFLRFSPLIALGTILAERIFIPLLVPAIILLLLTIPFGRFFCGWICPLGTIIDTSDRFSPRSGRKKRNETGLRLRFWKFFLLAVVGLAAIFSVQSIWFFDPIALLTRTLTTVLFPIFLFFLESILGILLGFEWLDEPVYLVYDWLHETIIPLEPHHFQNSILFLIIFMGILLLGWLTPRFWCRNLCPLGALLGIFSKFRILQRVVDNSCTNCGICRLQCKMQAIETDFKLSSPIECIECMNCVADCPTKSIKYKFQLKKQPAKIDFTKRNFLGAAVTGLAVVGGVKSSYLNREQKGKAIRPPGALEEPAFLNRCIRCHECTRICSTTGACLQPSMLESGWEGLWTPVSVPRSGFCEYNCNLCGQVCPTGAIKKLALPEKQKMKMGTASFDKNRCIPWYRFENCLVCEEHCPIPDKAIKFNLREVTRPDGEKVKIKFPYVTEALCVGCGICVTKCPLAGQAGIFVNTNGEIRVSSES